MANKSDIPTRVSTDFGSLDDGAAFWTSPYEVVVYRRIDEETAMGERSTFPRSMAASDTVWVANSALLPPKEETRMFQVGQKVRIETSPELGRCRWWPKSGEITGTVQKVYKNGKVMVGVHQLPNMSADRCRSLIFCPQWLASVSD